MSWIKLDDQIARHPKFIKAGPIASWLWVCGQSFCAQYLTDGFIPAEAVSSLGRINQPEKHAQRLVDVGLWDRESGGYRVHDYHDYQPSKVEVERRREERRKAGKKGGKRKAELWQNASNEPSKNEANVCPVPDPVPNASTKHSRTQPNGQIFSGQRFNVSERMFQNLTKGYGQTRVDAVDWLTLFQAWDEEAESKDEPVWEPLGWLRERVKRVMNTQPTSRAEPVDWVAECISEGHDPPCRHRSAHEIVMARRKPA